MSLRESCQHKEWTRPWQHGTLIVGILGSHYALGTCWLGRISPIHLFRKSAMAEVTTFQIVAYQDERLEKSISPYSSLCPWSETQSYPGKEVRIGTCAELVSYG